MNATFNYDVTIHDAKGNYRQGFDAHFSTNSPVSIGDKILLDGEEMPVFDIVHFDGQNPTLNVRSGE